jgi:hypothetical protein
VNISVSMHLWFQKVSARWVQKMLIQIWITLIFLTFTKFPNLRDKEGMRKNLLWVQLVKKLGYSSALFLRPLSTLTLKRKTSPPVKAYQKVIHCLHVEQKCFLLTPRSIRRRVPCGQGFKPKQTKTSVVK